MGGWGGQAQYPGSLSLPRVAASGAWALAAQAGNTLKGKKGQKPPEAKPLGWKAGKQVTGGVGGWTKLEAPSQP